MKQEEIFYHWKQAKRQVDVSPEFSDRVMEEVRLTSSHASHRAWLWPRLIEHIHVSAWAKVATIALACLMGFGRVVLTIHLLLAL